jgi:hypothetical protein
MISVLLTVDYDFFVSVIIKEMETYFLTQTIDKI